MIYPGDLDSAAVYNGVVSYPVPPSDAFSTRVRSPSVSSLDVGDLSTATAAALLEKSRATQSSGQLHAAAALFRPTQSSGHQQHAPAASVAQQPMEEAFRTRFVQQLGGFERGAVPAFEELMRHDMLQKKADLAKLAARKDSSIAGAAAGGDDEDLLRVDVESPQVEQVPNDPAAAEQSAPNSKDKNKPALTSPLEMLLHNKGFAGASARVRKRLEELEVERFLHLNMAKLKERSSAPAEDGGDTGNAQALMNAIAKVHENRFYQARKPKLSRLNRALHAVGSGASAVGGAIASGVGEVRDDLAAGLRKAWS